MALLSPKAAAEIVLMGAGTQATQLDGNGKQVAYLIAAVVVGGNGGSGSGGGHGAAKIGLDRLLVASKADDVREFSGFWDAKGEVSIDKFGYDTVYVGFGEDDESGINSINNNDELPTVPGQSGTLDIAIFKVPSGCAYGPPAYEGRDGDACDWPSLGVGATVTGLAPDGVTTTTTTYYCCHAHAIRAGACANSSETNDRLILTPNFTGHRRAVAVPHDDDGSGWTGNVSNGTILLSEPGTWVVAFASCDWKEFSVLLSGEIAFESSYGYLPAELYPYVVLDVALYVLCSGLFVWFLVRMVRHTASRIPVEKWILLTIALSMLEVLIQVAGYPVWNRTGYQNYQLAVAAMVAGALKGAVGRCVLLTAALGWGVTKESLQCLTVAGVVLLGAAAVPLELLVDLNLIHEGRDTHPQTFMGAMRVAAYTAHVVDGLENVAYVIFAVWTAAALGWTMWTLWKTRQTRKLGRYLQLAAVLLVSALGAAAVAAVAQFRMFQDIRYALLLGNAERAIFFVALAGVAILWRPNDSAREYAYSTQLPSSPEDEISSEGDYDAHNQEAHPRTEDDTLGADDARAVAARGAIELPRVS